MRSICDEVFPEDSGSKRMVAYGDGCLHHLTYGLVCRAFEEYGKGAYIHIDNHPDDYDLKGAGEDKISCEGFLEELVEDNDAESLLIGAHSDRFPSITFRKNPPTIEKWGISDSTSKETIEFNGNEEMWNDFLRSLEGLVRTLPDNVYVSNDLDFLASTEIKTGFLEGGRKTRELMDILDSIRSSKDVIGADVLGFPGSKDDKEVEKASVLYSAVIERVTEGTDKFEKKYYEVRDGA